MFRVQRTAVRRIGGLASVALVGGILTIATSLPAGAQSVPVASTCPSGPPVLQLGNPNPGDVLPNGDIIISGDAFDPGATSGTGVSSVDLFIGARDAGGIFLGSAVPGSTSASDPRAWSTKVTIPSNVNGGHDFVAYATSSMTGNSTSVTVPVFFGLAPTPTPTTDKSIPVQLSETTASTCAAAPGGTAPAAVVSAAPPASQAAVTPGEPPVLSLGNPSPEAVLSVGDLIVQGEAYDPAATDGSGVDSVQVFLDSRESGGIDIGNGAPGQNGAANARFFSIKATIPSGANGAHNFVVYAHSALTGQETVASVPVFIGVAPTPTPRPNH